MSKFYGLYNLLESQTELVVVVVVVVPSPPTGVRFREPVPLVGERGIREREDEAKRTCSWLFEQEKLAPLD